MPYKMGAPPPCAPGYGGAGCKREIGAGADYVDEEDTLPPWAGQDVKKISQLKKFWKRQIVEAAAISGSSTEPARIAGPSLSLSLSHARARSLALSLALARACSLCLGHACALGSCSAGFSTHPSQVASLFVWCSGEDARMRPHARLRACAHTLTR